MVSKIGVWVIVDCATKTVKPSMANRPFRTSASGVRPNELCEIEHVIHITLYINIKFPNRNNDISCPYQGRS